MSMSSVIRPIDDTEDSSPPPTIRSTDLCLHLPDGRFLGYTGYGNPRGRPLLFFHGTYGSRRLGQVLDDAAIKLGVRVIAPDRPGYGLSDYQSHRSLLSWASDVGMLVDALDIVRFAVLGVSGGGPHALACAFAMPGRITAAGVAGGNPPPHLANARVGAPRGQQLAVSFFLYAPALLGLYFTMLTHVVGGSPERILASFEAGVPACA